MKSGKLLIYITPGKCISIVFLEVWMFADVCKTFAWDWYVQGIACKGISLVLKLGGVKILIIMKNYIILPLLPCSSNHPVDVGQAGSAPAVEGGSSAVPVITCCMMSCQAACCPSPTCSTGYLHVMRWIVCTMQCLKLCGYMASAIKNSKGSKSISRMTRRVVWQMY